MNRSKVAVSILRGLHALHSGFSHFLSGIYNERDFIAEIKGTLFALDSLYGQSFINLLSSLVAS